LIMIIIINAKCYNWTNNSSSNGRVISVNFLFLSILLIEVFFSDSIRFGLPHRDSVRPSPFDPVGARQPKLPDQDLPEEWPKKVFNRELYTDIR